LEEKARGRREGGCHFLSSSKGGEGEKISLKWEKKGKGGDGKMAFKRKDRNGIWISLKIVTFGVGQLEQKL